MPVDPIAISRSALDVEWQRMQIAAMNLAHQNTVLTGESGYRPQALISAPAIGFAETLESGVRAVRLEGTRVAAIATRADAVRQVYDPQHPMASPAGFVSYPDIDQAQEMVTLMRSARSYESNLTALALTQQMAMRALDIGRR